MSIKKTIAHPVAFWIILSLLHICVLSFLYLKFGVSTLNEGDKYLSRATYLANGNFVNATQYQTFYIAYVSYLSVFVFLKVPTLLIFISTWLISLFAYYKFYQLILAFIDDTTAKLWLVFIGVSPLVQYWQFNLFSETFFIAISLLFTYSCLFPKIKNRNLKIFLLAFITVFSRPSGIFTVVCILLLKLYIGKQFTKRQALYTGSAILLILFVGILFLFQLPYHDFSKFISTGSIYYGFPGWVFPELPPGNYTLFDCYKFIVEHKGVKTLLGLFIQKFDSFFVTTRPYYSNFHNSINSIHQLLYPFAALAFFIAFKKQKKILWFLYSFLIIILLNAFMITFIFNEWSERHTLHVFPYIMLLSAYTLSYLWTVYVKKQDFSN